MIGARFAPFGTRITVWSFTPSRIAIMTSRRSKSAAAFGGVNFAGMSGVSGGVGSTASRPNENVTSAGMRRLGVRMSRRDYRRISPRAQSVIVIDRLELALGQRGQLGDQLAYRGPCPVEVL